MNWESCPVENRWKIDPPESNENIQFKNWGSVLSIYLEDWKKMHPHLTPYNIQMGFSNRKTDLFYQYAFIKFWVQFNSEPTDKKL